MPTAIPGFGLAGADSRETGGQVNLLELTDGVGLQQFKRRSVVNRSMQAPIITSWGITPTASIFPESITLTIAEEGIPHEGWVGEYGGNGTPNLLTDVVQLDAFLIFRARATLNITGKSNVNATDAALFNSAAWACPVGPWSLPQALSAAGLTNADWIAQNKQNTEPRTDWHNFNRTWTKIRPGTSAGAHVLAPAMIDADTVGRGTYTFTWTFMNEGFPTKAESFQQA